MGVPLHIIYHFSLVAFNTTSLSLIFISLITMYVPWCVPTWVYPIWDFLSFLYLVDDFLCHVKEVFS